MGALVKDATVTTLVAAVPARPAAPAVAFHMYAPPPPKGWAYRPLTAAVNFNSWSPLREAALTSTTTFAATGSVFFPLEDLPEGFPLPNGATPVYGTVTLSPGNVPPTAYGLTGYFVPTFSSVTVYNEAQWYAPLSNMTYYTFAGDVESNGYPIGPPFATYTGTCVIPTIDGQVTVTRYFVKNEQGFLRSAGAIVNPDYCITKPVHGIIALLDFPGRDFVPEVPAVTSTDYNVGWNAGANSVSSLDGDLHVVFEVAIAAAGAVGFTSHRPDETAIGSLSHAFYFDSHPETGQPRCRPIEFGNSVANSFAYDPANVFEIRRETADGIVTFVYNGDEVHVSSRPAYGALNVGCALYRAGDTIL